MLSKLCCCLHLQKGCIIISLIGFAISGGIFVFQTNLWSIIGFVLVILSSIFLLLGTIKHMRMATIMYLILEMIHIIEIFAACLVIFVDLIAFEDYKCICHGLQCENDNICERIGIMLGSIFGIYTLVDIYFWICAFGLLMETHVGKSLDCPA